MSDAKGYAHMFLMVILAIAIYNTIVKAFLPVAIVNWVGI